MPRLNRLSLFIISVSFQAALFGQTFYKVLGAIGVDESAQCVEATADGDYVIGGAKGDSALIIKVDPTGAVLWSKCFKPVSAYPNSIYQIASTPDGHLTGVGNALPPGTIYGTTFLFKFDLAGNMLWQTHSVDSRPIWTHRIMPISDMQYMAMSEVYDVSSPTYSDIFTGMVNAGTGLLDSNGPRLNYISGNPYIDDISCAAIGTAGSVYGSGRIYISGSSASSMRAFVTKFDSNGGHVWSKYLMYPASQAARIYGSDIIYSGDSLTSCYTGDINGASANFTVGLVRMDTLGNVAWSKDYHVQGYSSTSAYTVLQMPYGYAITGYGIASDHDLFVVAVSSTGQLLWAKSYGESNSSVDLLQAATTQSVAIGSDILLTGTKHTTSGTDIVLARVDGSGNISCGTGSSLVVTTTTIPPFSMTVDPTPYPDPITFTAPTPQISSYPIDDLCPSVQLDLGPDTATCGPITLNASVPNASYLWSTGSTDPSIDVNGPGTVWVEVTVDCCIYTDTVVVSVSTPGTPSFSTATSPCDLSLSTLNSSVGSFSYLWNFGDGQTSTDNQPTHAYSAAGTYEITLTVTNACGSQDTTMEVQLLPLGSFSISGPDTLCADQAGAYSASLSSASLSSITWSSGADSSDIVFASSTSTLLYATATDTNNCSYSDTISINIIPGQLDVIGPSAICSDKPVQFHVSYNGSGLHYVHWSTGDTTATITTNPMDGEVIQVVAVDDVGCLLESSYVVQQIGDEGVGAAYIPNAFTPNKDGSNDSFEPVIFQGFISMQIFDRWGHEIYETTAINDPWRGDSKGNPVPDGTYVYVVKWDDQCTGDAVSRIGSVTLLR